MRAYSSGWCASARTVADGRACGFGGSLARRSGGASPIVVFRPARRRLRASWRPTACLLARARSRSSTGPPWTLKCPGMGWFGPRLVMPQDEASAVPPIFPIVSDERARPPLHVLIVHFPFVLWGMSFVFDVASMWRGPAMVEAALFNLVAGLAASVAAAVTGIWDYFTRLPRGSTARRIARWHALANATTTALFAVSLALRWPMRGAA